MKRKNAKELLPIIKAFSEGKQIQFFNGDKWIDIEYPNFSEKPCLYRIKPESQYRPFKSVEECWDEMQKHQPFGWVMDRNKNYECFLSVHNKKDFSYLLKNFIFADGSPFGIKEE